MKNCRFCGCYLTTGGCSNAQCPSHGYIVVNNSNYFVSSHKGWQCPCCNMVYAPHVNYCDCRSSAKAANPEKFKSHIPKEEQ